MQRGVSKKTWTVALSGVLAALALAFLYLASVLPTGQLGVAAVAGLFPMAAVISATVSPFARREAARWNISSFRRPSVTLPGASLLFACLGLSFLLWSMSRWSQSGRGASGMLVGVLLASHS